MRAGELMVGDYVIRKNVPKEILIVDTIDSIRGIVYLDLDGLGITEKLENIEPIPLTQKILEKNGFKKELSEDNIHYRFILIYDGVRFSLLYARSVFQWLGPLDFKYVHELQHALRLCGINKEIKA